MNWSLLFKRDNSAPVACERLQILLAHERSALGRSNLISDLKERERDDRDDEIARLKSKVGEITMDDGAPDRAAMPTTFSFWYDGARPRRLRPVRRHPLRMSASWTEKSMQALSQTAKTARIRELNDAFRRTFAPGSQIT